MSENIAACASLRLTSAALPTPVSLRLSQVGRARCHPGRLLFLNLLGGPSSPAYELVHNSNHQLVSVHCHLGASVVISAENIIKAVRDLINASLSRVEDSGEGVEQLCDSLPGCSKVFVEGGHGVRLGRLVGCKVKEGGDCSALACLVMR